MFNDECKLNAILRKIEGMQSLEDLILGLGTKVNLSYFKVENVSVVHNFRLDRTDKLIIIEGEIQLDYTELNYKIRFNCKFISNSILDEGIDMNQKASITKYIQNETLFADFKGYTSPVIHSEHISILEKIENSLSKKTNISRYDIFEDSDESITFTYENIVDGMEDYTQCRIEKILMVEIYMSILSDIFNNRFRGDVTKKFSKELTDNIEHEVRKQASSLVNYDVDEFSY